MLCLFEQGVITRNLLCSALEKPNKCGSTAPREVLAVRPSTSYMYGIHPSCEISNREQVDSGCLPRPIRKEENSCTDPAQWSSEVVQVGNLRTLLCNGQLSKPTNFLLSHGK
jgi:hypothetical protein